MTDHPPQHIGLLREKPLHASLKEFYAIAGDTVEVPVDGYVVDLVRGALLIEVQTRGFSSMKRKLHGLLAEGHQVRILYPVPVDKWIIKVGDGGEILSRRRSPRHGSAVDVFAELVSFPALFADPLLEIDVVSIIEEEVRFHDPDGPWRRKGWRVAERRLVEALGITQLRGPRDLVALLPDRLPKPFTTRDVAEGLNRPQRLAQQTVYCLRKMDAVVPVGKTGNAIEYEFVV